MKKLKTEELNRLSVEDFRQSQKNNIIVLLDNIRSMNNIGSVFRTCDAFNVEKLLLCGITATPPHREIQKTALDATLSVHWEYHENPAIIIQQLKAEGYISIAVEQTDESLMLQDIAIKPDDKILLIFGNEVNGVSDEVLEHCDVSLEIPQYGTKHSLNVSVCAGIVIWEFVSKKLNTISL
jgi:tRNA G18 (ribose-2'-O)-methylase SpoU